MNYEEKKKRAELHALKVKQFRELCDIWHSNDNRKPWSFTKKLMAFILVNCTVIEIYSLIVMWVFGDLSALSVLITAVVGECISLISYQIKSTYENREGGITYETAMFEMKDRLKDDTDEAVG